MSKKIFIVLFVASALLNVYLFTQKETKTVETEKVSENQSSTSVSVDDKQMLLDSIRKLVIEKSELQYFDLQDNSYAQDYFAEMGIDNASELITSAILKTNTTKGKHPLICFEPKNKLFQTNKIKILNHKWIICDFSDGAIWGELLLKYHIDDNKNVEFTVLDDLLYPEEK